MFEQTGDPMLAKLRQWFARLWHEQVLACLTMCKGLVEMPARCVEAGNRRSAHEAGQVAVTPCDLLHRIPEQTHRVGHFQARHDIERDFELTRGKLIFDAAQRHAKGQQMLADDRHDGVDLVEVILEVKGIALGDRLDARRLGGGAKGPDRLGGQAWVDDSCQIELDFQAGVERIAFMGEVGERALEDRARAQGKGIAVRQIQISKQPTSLVCPWQYSECRGVRHHHRVGRTLQPAVVEATSRRERIECYGAASVMKERRHGDFRSRGERRLDRGYGQALASQQPVLIGIGQADDLQTFRFDPCQDLCRSGTLLRRPKVMTFNKFLRHLFSWLQGLLIASRTGCACFVSTFTCADPFPGLRPYATCDGILLSPMEKKKLSFWQ